MIPFIVTWAGLVAIFLADRHNTRRITRKLNIMADDQTQLDADVTALTGVFTSLQTELSDLEAYKAAHPDAPASSVDLSKLNAIVAQFQGLVPAAAPAPAPVDPTATVVS